MSRKRSGRRRSKLDRYSTEIKAWFKEVGMVQRRRQSEGNEALWSQKGMTYRQRLRSERQKRYRAGSIVQGGVMI